MKPAISTRTHNGEIEPAYVRAPIRKTQSMFDLERQLENKRSMLAELRDLRAAARAPGASGDAELDRPQPGIAAGTANHLIGLSAAVIVTGALLALAFT